MTSEQLCFDFTVAAPAAAPRATRTLTDPSAGARAFWRTDMVTSLPLFCEVQGLGRRYTMMLPGVVESISGDLASVRIYAAPEYGYTLENYPLHLKLAVDVPLRDLGRYHGNVGLQRLADEGRLATGDAQLAAAVRARNAGSDPAREREHAEAV